MKDTLTKIQGIVKVLRKSNPNDKMSDLVKKAWRSKRGEEIKAEMREKLAKLPK